MAAKKTGGFKSRPRVKKATSKAVVTKRKVKRAVKTAPKGSKRAAAGYASMVAGSYSKGGKLGVKRAGVTKNGKIRKGKVGLQGAGAQLASSGIRSMTGNKTIKKAGKKYGTRKKRK